MGRSTRARPAEAGDTDGTGAGAERSKVQALLRFARRWRQKDRPCTPAQVFSEPGGPAAGYLPSFEARSDRSCVRGDRKEVGYRNSRCSLRGQEPASEVDTWEPTNGPFLWLHPGVGLLLAFEQHNNHGSETSAGRSTAGWHPHPSRGR